MYEVEIRDMPGLKLHGLLHKGPYHQISATFERLGALLGERDLIEHATLWVGVYVDDPQTTAQEDLHSYACCAFAEGSEVPDEMRPVEIEPARAAVLSYRGDYAGLADAWQWFVATWSEENDAPGSGAPCYEIHRTMAPAVPVEEQLTEIVVPLA